MDAGQLDNMPHCTDDLDTTTDCGVVVDDAGTSYIQYSWGKSLIQTYLNETFYNEIKDKIGNTIVKSKVCNDPSDINVYYTYGGFLESEITAVNDQGGALGVANKTVSCKTGFSEYNVRLITATEYANISPTFEYELPATLYGTNSSATYPDISYIEPLETSADNTWLQSSNIGDWWSMTSWSEELGTDAASAYVIGDVDFGFKAAKNVHRVRPVITVAK